jgi:hypothetical protein
VTESTPPAVKLATALWRETGQQFPFDVVGYARQIARLEFRAIPGGCDALLLVGGDLPRIIVDSSANDNRRRFSIAHELAHLTIEWHVGNSICAPFSISEDDEIVAATEKEANQFAAELLMPSYHVEPRATWIDEGNIIDEVFELAEAAGVSPISAMLRMVPEASLAAQLVVVDSDSTVVASARSDSCALTPAVPPSKFQARPSKHIQVKSRDFGRYTMLALLPQAQLPPLKPTRHTPTDTLRAFLRRKLPSNKVAGAIHTINGIIGNANGKRADITGYEAFYSVLLQRVSQREDLSSFLDEAVFREFLLRRARQLRPLRQ